MDQSLFNIHRWRASGLLPHLGSPSLGRSCQCDDFPSISWRPVWLFLEVSTLVWLGGDFWCQWDMHNSSSSSYKSKYSCGEVLDLRCWGLRSIVHVGGARRGPEWTSLEEPPGPISRGGSRARNHLEQQSSPCALVKDNLPFSPASFRTSHPDVCRPPHPNLPLLQLQPFKITSGGKKTAQEL